jgi:hypothetical protein
MDPRGASPGLIEDPRGQCEALAASTGVGIINEDARTELKALRHDTRRASPLFQEIMDIGRQFERAVLALLFDTRLAALSQQYVVF